MALQASRDDKLNTVKKSPEAVAAHDREAWMAIFASQNVVEDPVGSQPHVSGVFDGRSGVRGNAPLQRFFDTFIAPNTIQFHVDRDIVCDNHVVRDLAIEIHMAPKVAIQVPMHLLYELVSEENSVRISQLAAHWEPWPMVRQLLAKGSDAYGVLMALSIRMLKNQGLGGALGFSKGFFTVGETGKSVVQQFVVAFNDRKQARLASLFEVQNQGISLPYGKPASHVLDVFEQPIKSLKVSKLLAAGYVVSATLQAETETGLRDGVALFEFNLRSKRLTAVRCYWED